MMREEGLTAAVEVPAAVQGSALGTCDGGPLSAEALIREATADEGRGLWDPSRIVATADGEKGPRWVTRNWARRGAAHPAARR